MLPPEPEAGAREAARLARFGLTLGAAFAIAAVLFAWQSVPYASAAMAGAGALFLLGAALHPRALRPVERAWTAPAGLWGRLLPKGPPPRGWDPGCDSYLVPCPERRTGPASFERLP